MSPHVSPSTQISWAPANLDLPSGNHTGLRKDTHLGRGIAVSCNSNEKSVLGKKGICRTAEADMSWYETMSNKLSSVKAQCSCLAHCHHNALDPVYWSLYIFITEEEWTAASCVEHKRGRKKLFSKKNRMWDSEKSFWEKSEVGGLERKLRRKLYICKKAQVFNIIFASYLWGCLFRTLLIPTFALYLNCQQSFLISLTSLVVSVQKQPQSLTAHSECYSKPPQKWMGFHHTVSFTWAAVLQHSSSFFFTRTHTWISSYMGSKISVCLETMSHERKYWKMLRLVSSRDKVLIPLGLTTKSLLYQKQVQCVIVLGRQEIREQKRLLNDLLSLLVVAWEPQMTIVC